MLKISLEGSLELPDNSTALLCTLFSEQRQIIVKREFSTNLSGSRVYIMEPISDHGSELPVVVKFAATSLIEKEWQAYQRVHKMLHGMLKVQGKALPPGTWSALYYPLAGGGTVEFESLYDYCRQHEPAAIRDVLGRIFRTLETIHNQSEAVPGFLIRASYDRCLPVNLLVELQSPPAGTEITTINAQQPGNVALQPNDWVRLEGFLVTKANLRKNTLTLNLPAKEENPDAYCVRIKLPDTHANYHKNDILEVIEGKVVATRQSQLNTYWQALLGPTASADDPFISSPQGFQLPNPLIQLKSILAKYDHVRIALIHGDLNLNNVLINTETGAVQIIDIAEARQDHILHDFLHLETEVITHIVPELLREHALPPAAALHTFYQNLHCATFETRSISDHTPPPELRKPFEIICAIRRASRRHLYASQPREYYQGLLLYLTGALKFSNLNAPPLAPLPKQAALWAAASVAQLLEKTLTCPPLQVPQEETRPPHASIIDYQPQVKILRPGSDRLVPATQGSTLYCGDIVSTYTNSEARVECREGGEIYIPPEHNQCIDCQNLPPNKGTRKKGPRQDALLPYLVNVFTHNLGHAAQQPALLSPRNTHIREPRPTFRWQPIVGAESYRLSVRMPNGAGWQQETTSTQLSYPHDAPPLAPGSGNSVILEGLGSELPAEHSRLARIDAAAESELQAAEATLDETHLSTGATHYRRAQLYRERKLWAAALAQLERVTHYDPQARIAWLQKGELNLRMALYPQAVTCYTAALPLIAESTQAGLQTVTHIGLAAAHHAQGNVKEAHAHLDIVNQGEYATLTWRMRQRFANPARSKLSGTNILTAVQNLTETLYAPLKPHIALIGEFLLPLLEGIPLSRLDPSLGITRGTLGDDMTTREMLAACYFVTREMRDTLAPAEIERQAQSGQLFYTLEECARSIAVENLGFDAERAEEFARQYADLVGNSPHWLVQLQKRETP